MKLVVLFLGVAFSIFAQDFNHGDFSRLGEIEKEFEESFFIQNITMNLEVAKGFDCSPGKAKIRVYTQDLAYKMKCKDDRRSYRVKIISTLRDPAPNSYRIKRVIIR